MTDIDIIFPLSMIMLIRNLTIKLASTMLTDFTTSGVDMKTLEEDTPLGQVLFRVRPLSLTKGPEITVFVVAVTRWKPKVAKEANAHAIKAIQSVT